MLPTQQLIFTQWNELTNSLIDMMDQYESFHCVGLIHHQKQSCIGMERVWSRNKYIISIFDLTDHSLVF